MVAGFGEGACREPVFQENQSCKSSFLGSSDPVSTVVKHHFRLSAQRGGDVESTSCWENGKLTPRRACCMGSIMGHRGHLWNTPSATGRLATARAYFLLKVCCGSRKFSRVIVGLAVQAAASISQLLHITRDSTNTAAGEEPQGRSHPSSWIHHLGGT